MRVDSSAVLKLINAIQEEVTCPLCFEVFRQPKSLTCIHTFCQCCLQLICKLILLFSGQLSQLFILLLNSYLT